MCVRRVQICVCVCVYCALRAHVCLLRVRVGENTDLLASEVESRWLMGLY